MRCRTIFTRDASRHAAASSVLLCAFLFPCALASAQPLGKSDTTDTDGAPLSADAQAALQDVLTFDPMRWMNLKPAIPRSANSSAQDLDWNRTDKSDGSAALTVRKPLPFEWDAKVGADFGLAPAAGTSYQPDKTLLNRDQSTGATWANVTVPGGASIDARIDPSKDQSKFGTTFNRSVPFGNSYSMTLQNSFAVTETIGGAQVANAAPGTAPPSQVWSNDRLVKFNFLSTGTSLAAGTSSSNAAYAARNKIQAEQKLFDSLNITTAVTDVGAPTTSKSITAGFKWKW